MYNILKNGIVIMISLSFLSSCFFTKIVELKNINDFKVVEQFDTLKKRNLIFTGYLNESSKGINKIKTKIDGDTINIKVYSSIVTKNTTGQLNYSLLVPDEINFITFGEKSGVVWKRN